MNSVIKLFSITFIIISFSSCQNLQLKARHNEKTNTPTQTTSTTPVPPSSAFEEKPIEPTTPPAVPVPLLPISTPPRLDKIGLILGPGLMRSYAEIGVLQSLVKAKMPIDSIIGIEWGAFIAAAYSVHGQSNDVEWQLMKIKDDTFNKKGLLTSSGPQDISDLQNYLNDIFQQTKIEQARIPFVCPAFDIVKKQVFWMKRGEFAKALPYCLASPPLFKPFQNNVPAVDLKMTVDYLKSKGINYIILVNVVPVANPLLGEEDKSSEGFRDQIIWSQWQLSLQKYSNLVNYTIEVSLDKTPIQDATVRRDLIKIGRDVGQNAAAILSTKLGF
jgi:NTE family protein